MKNKVVLVIGHDPVSTGAVNKNSGISEHKFNSAIAYSIKEKHPDCIVVSRDDYNLLPNKINALCPDLIISLHCNAFDKKATGTETLYFHSSIKGRKIASIFQKNIVDVLGLADRGIKARNKGDRGSWLLRKTIAPAIITEPFFIDNDNDLMTAEDKMAALVEAYVNSIKEVFT